MAVTLVENGDWQEVSRASGSYGAATLTCVVYAKCHDRQIDNNRHYVEVKQVTYVVNNLSGSGYQFDATLCGSQSGGAVWTFENGEVVNSGGGWVGHNDDGTKSMWIGAYAYNKYWGVSLSYGDTVNLPTIPRASTPSITSASTAKDLGSNIAISISRASSSFKHTINIKDGSTIVETLGNKNIDTSTTWTPSTTTYAPLITSGDTKTFTIECLTFNGNTQIGSKTCTAILKVLDSTIPSVSIALAEADSTMISKNWGVYVQGKSKLAVTLTATKAYNANISSYSSSVDGVPYTGSSYTTPVLTKSGAQTATATVTDTRNHTSDQASKSYTVVEYNRPSIATALCERCNSDGTPNDEGTSLKYTFKASISPILNGSTPKNTKSFKIYYKAKSASSYTQLANVTPSGSTTASYTLNKELQVISSVTFSSSTTYVIKFEVTDAFETISIEREIGTGFDLMNFNSSGKSMAIGKVSEASSADKILEVALDSDFKETAIFRKDITYKGSLLDTLLASTDIPVGTIIPFTSASVPSGYMVCDGSAISRTTYAELFSVIGTTYGSGNGSTTFNIPNLKGRVLVGLNSNDASFDSIGETGGSKYLQEHDHGEYVNNGSGGRYPFTLSNGGGSRMAGNYFSNNSIFSNYTGPQVLTTKTGTGNSGNLQPYIVVNYIIKVARGTATVPSSVTVTNADVAQITTNKNDITELKNAVPKIATAQMEDYKTFSANVKYTMDSIVSTTNQLTLYSGGIKIGSGISKVLVSAQTFAQTNTNNGYVWTAIKKNSSNVSISIDNPSTCFCSVIHSPKLIDVVEGDVIYLYDIGSTSTGTIRGTNNTYLTVQVIS